MMRDECRPWSDVIRTDNYEALMTERWELEWSVQHPPELGLDACAPRRVGYLVGNFSPVTRAHAELAARAVAELGLDYLFLVIRPLEHIPGYHAVDPSAGHPPWAERIELAELTFADPRIQVLRQVRAWYRESACNADRSQPASACWTGSWYVLRRLQWHLRQAGASEFTFVCGADRFRTMPEPGFWQDYLVTQQLALHDVYRAERDGHPLPYVARGGTHRVITTGPLRHGHVSGARVRSGGIVLEDDVVPAVAERIRRTGWWGYGAGPRAEHELAPSLAA
jgi:nicotinic acid mononucleotide adenylyltransferase